MDHCCKKVIAGRKRYVLLLGSDVWWQDLMLYPWTVLRRGGGIIKK